MIAKREQQKMELGARRPGGPGPRCRSTSCTLLGDWVQRAKANIPPFGLCMRSRYYINVEPAGWNPWLPVRAGAEKVQLEAGGASYA